MWRLKDIVVLLLFCMNALCALLFLLSCMAPFISPAAVWIFAFFGLAFPALLFVNILWLPFWLIFKRRFMLISGVVLLLGAWNISSQFAWKTCHSVKVPENSFSVMSFNVKVFDLYSWTQNTASKDHILQIIKNLQPDILCIQEFYTDNDKFNTLEELRKIYPYYYFHKTVTIEEVHQWGIATFSKFPIAGEELIPFRNSLHNTCIASDIVINEDTVRVFNAHLQSVYFNQEDYEDVKNLMERQLEKVPLLKSFGKLKVAFEKRAVQAELLRNRIETSSYKAIVCSDFNDTPNSYAYRTISKGLLDSFLESGCGFGLTYTGPYPFLRIDYILTDPGIKPLANKTQWNYSSDHFAAYGIFKKP